MPVGPVIDFVPLIDNTDEYTQAQEQNLNLHQFDTLFDGI